MFKRQAICLLLIFLAATIYSAWIFHSPNSRDYHKYQKLMAYTDSVKPVQTQSLAKQQRHHVQKQFIFNQGGQRLQWRIDSAESEIFMDHKGHSIEFVERMKGLFCVMQEKKSDIVVDSMKNFYQIIRCIEAKEAIYRYKDKELMAEQVELTRYRIPDHQWVSSLKPYTPIMQGHAQSIQLTLSKEPLFKAQGFQAVFQEWE